DFLHDCKPETGATFFSARHERQEQLVLDVLWNSRTGIGKHENELVGCLRRPRVTLLARCANRKSSSLVRHRFDRVARKVMNRTKHFSLVKARRASLLHVDLELDPKAFHLRL